MGEFRKKPVIIEAFKFGKETLPIWAKEAFKNRLIEHTMPISPLLETKCVEIKTLEGTMKAEYGDYIIKGIKGEIYPCKPDIFEQTYEPVEQI